MCARAMPATVYVAVDRHLLGRAVMRARVKVSPGRWGSGGSRIPSKLLREKMLPLYFFKYNFMFRSSEGTREGQRFKLREDSCQYTEKML